MTCSRGEGGAVELSPGRVFQAEGRARAGGSSGRRARETPRRPMRKERQSECRERRGGMRGQGQTIRGW